MYCCIYLSPLFYLKWIEKNSFGMTFIDFNWTPILIPFLLGIKNYRSFDKAFKILFFFVVVGVITEVSSFLARRLLDSKNTMPVSNFYVLFSFFPLCWYYIEAMKDFVKTKIAWIVVILFEMWAIGHLLIAGDIHTYPSAALSVSNILYLIFALVFFYKIMVEARIKKLWEDPYILVNIAVVIYYAGSLFYSILFNILLHDSVEFLKMTVIYFSILNAFFYAMITWAFSFFSKKKTQVQ